MAENTKKYAAEDKKYISARNRFADKYDKPYLWPTIDHWPLYAGVYSISRFLAITKLVEQTLDVPGHIAEVGCWRGANLLLMAKLLRLLDPHSGKQVHAFDSFQGLQDYSKEDAGAEGTRGQYRGSLEELRDLIKLYDFEDEVIIHLGKVESTLAPLLKRRTELSFSLVYIDVDLYTPTLIALEQLHSRLALGGMFVFDEWNVAVFPGETVAVQEFLQAHPDDYNMEHVRNTRQPSLILRKKRP
jgi:SAM-dependent methyltransferase